LSSPAAKPLLPAPLDANTGVRPVAKPPTAEDSPLPPKPLPSAGAPHEP
jgi:hypothetical protein